ncbi:hypothetical protein IW15_22255 [Chryseobacterium soli]|uniref:Uncharacterized protein n=1 Tax=Chryseobacterium soli TaxID=445961 RepID=A0A085ZZB9_9FLAO|nr:hypothetical protein IW15_22255 [Chryseobacterium soli]
MTGCQIIQAADSPKEAYTRTEIDGDARIVISEGISVSGLENLRIITVEINKTQNQSKNSKKTKTVKKIRSQKTERKIAKTRQTPKTAYNFSNNPKSDTHLCHPILRGTSFAGPSFSFKCILANEVKILSILLVITGIFLINFYKSRSFSGNYFLQNFQRPPPELML